MPSKKSLKIIFIQPAIGRKDGERYIKSWKNFKPPAFAILKSLTPPDIETEFVDDRIEFIDYEKKADLVAISTESCNALRSSNISEEFRKRGIKVVIGGSQATFVPDEVASYADIVFTGNAEDKWPELIEDLRGNKLKKRYDSRPGFSQVMPDYSIFKNKSYSDVALIETGRGCYYDCSICSVAAYYKRKHYNKDLKIIAREFEEAESGYVFLLDDNFISDADYAASFLKAIAPYGKKWIGQASLNIALDDRLLKLARKAGCMEILIGFETLDINNLALIRKKWQTGFGRIEDLVKKIHDAGISIYANFVLGFDHDDEKTFDSILEFSLKNAFQMAGYNTLLPYPNTHIYNVLKKQGRMDKTDWWLNPDFRFGDIPFVPKKMTKDELIGKSIKLRKDFYKFSSVARRLGQFLKFNFDPVMSLLVLREYFSLNREIDAKIGIPLAANLDSGVK